MQPESDPHLNETQTRPGRGASIKAIIGAVLGAVASSQFVSTLGFLLDIAADSNRTFRAIGSIIGILIGIPAGIAAGRQFSHGKRPDIRVIAIGAVVGCLVFSATLLIPSSVHPIAKLLSPGVGLVSGSILGAIVSLHIPDLLNRS